MDYRDLKEALKHVAVRVDQERVFKDNPEMDKANKTAVQMFTQRGDTWKRRRGERRRNITRISLWRVNRYLRRSGIDWPNLNWEAILKWLYENWDKILGVLLSLLIFI